LTTYSTLGGTDLQTLEQLTFVAFDLETTGLNASRDRILEIGAVRFSLSDQTESHFSVLVDPSGPIPEEVIAVHGITPEMVKGAPIFADVAAGFLAFVGDALLLAHNASFDLAFVACELRRARLPVPDLRGFDSCRLARPLIPESPNYKLQTLIQHFGFDPGGQAHRSLPDARACAHVFRQCVARLPQGTATPLADLLQAYPQAPAGVDQVQQAAPALSRLAEQIRVAIHERQDLKIHYMNARSQHLERQVTPIFLGGVGGYTYLEAFCHLRQEQRQFRLNRISALALAV